MTDARESDIAGEGAPEAETRYWSPIAQRFVTQAERIAAARVRVVIDPKRGVETPQWIVDLAKQHA